MSEKAPLEAVDVQLACDGVMPTADEIARWANAVLDDEERPLCIRVVEESEGKELNSRFRAVEHATNVLSFPADAADYLGDIAICDPVVVREAEAQGKHVLDHYAHLVVHGVLHLLGYDHDDDVDAQRMESKEAAILAGFGIGDPYERHE